MRYVVLAGVVALSNVCQAQGLEPIETPPTWLPGPQEYYTHSTCLPGVSTIEDSIDRAVKELERYSVPFTNVGTHNSFDRDNRNTIGCATESPFLASLVAADSDLIYRDYGATVHRGDQHVTGATARVWSRVSTGEIVEWDVWLDTFFVIDQAQGLRVIRHELGHVAGLVHVDDPGSLMNASPTESDWDIGTIAILSLHYEKCRVEVDNKANLWLPNVAGFYGIMPVNGVWPHDAFNVSETPCQED